MEAPPVFHRTPTPHESAGGYFNTTKSADFLGLATRTLERHRLDGTGPVFMRLGRRILYHPDDLRAWAQQHRYRSTSEPSVTPTRVMQRSLRRA
ncbi:DNA-binding protein [Lichenibacterium minor]|uniref:DNA-binding protein n=1 Tax=Lichenibacterium minor TaxID=2316528 RepID=A0A4Q2U7P1_9HYPH|nr:DNA-binding protein [Lichenibacterium minor]